jgi:hypothetical protein
MLELAWTCMRRCQAVIQLSESKREELTTWLSSRILAAGVLDNLSAHNTQAVTDFLDRNPRARFHFTPTCSSWINQVEIWFAKIQRGASRGASSPQSLISYEGC